MFYCLEGSLCFLRICKNHEDYSWFIFKKVWKNLVCFFKIWKNFESSWCFTVLLLEKFQGISLVLKKKNRKNLDPSCFIFSKSFKESWEPLVFLRTSTFSTSVLSITYFLFPLCFSPTPFCSCLIANSFQFYFNAYIFLLHFHFSFLLLFNISFASFPFLFTFSMSTEFVFFTFK